MAAPEMTIEARIHPAAIGTENNSKLFLAALQWSVESNRNHNKMRLDPYPPAIRRRAGGAPRHALLPHLPRSASMAALVAFGRVEVQRAKVTRTWATGLIRCALTTSKETVVVPPFGVIADLVRVALGVESTVSQASLHHKTVPSAGWSTTNMQDQVLVFHAAATVVIERFR